GLNSDSVDPRQGNQAGCHPVGCAIPITTSRGPSAGRSGTWVQRGEALPTRQRQRRRPCVRLSAGATCAPGPPPSADLDDRQDKEPGLPFPAVSEASAPNVRTPCVLVVDDEAFFRRVLSETVERQGYTVLGARDASETLRFFE